MPVIVTGCWKCGKTSHLSSFCPENGAIGFGLLAGSIPPLVESVVSVSSVMGMPTIGIGVVKAPLRIMRGLYLPKSFCQPLVGSRRRKRVNGWSLARAEGSSGQRNLSSRKLLLVKTCTVPLTLAVPSVMNRPATSTR